MIIFRFISILYLLTIFFIPSILASDYEEIRKRDGDVERVLGEDDGTNLIREEGSVKYYETGDSDTVKNDNWDTVGVLEKD